MDVISLYSGTVGSGKSFHAVELGLQWVSRGKYVIANYPIKVPDGKWYYKRFNVIRKYYNNQNKNWIFNDEISVPYLISKSIEMGWIGKESQCMLQIDEAGIPFNSRSWAVDQEKRNGWIKFFSLSRKLGYDVVLVAQHNRMLDRQIRDLLEYDVQHLKANNSFFLRFLSAFKITLFMYVYRWHGTKVKANLRFGRYKKSIANRYDTMRLFNMDELIEAIKKIYEGKIMPGPVMTQIELWQDELIAKMKEEEEDANVMPEESGESDGGEGVPADESDVSGIIDAEPTFYIPDDTWLDRLKDKFTLHYDERNIMNSSEEKKRRWWRR